MKKTIVELSNSAIIITKKKMQEIKGGDIIGIEDIDSSFIGIEDIDAA